MRRGTILRWFRSPVRVAYLGCVALFLWCVGQFHQGETGFSSLISIGDKFRATQATALKRVPHYLYEGSPGYDGAYYVQLALHPTLDHPELDKAIDNVPYRSRRILFSWVAWLFGLGQPAWIVQAFALLNVAAWVGLAWALLRWFPAGDWGAFLRWFAVMFSHGACMSVRHSLVDVPALFLIVLALRWVEQGRRIAGPAALALAGLGRETSLLAVTGLDFDPRSPRTWGRAAFLGAVIALPLLAWMLWLRLKFGPAADPGMGNFTWPVAGFFEKARDAWRAARSPDTTPLHWATVIVVIALATQWLFFALRWRPAERWWRLGATYALLMTFLATPVWEGFPGASTRVLLPMTLAFNILVPRGVRWLPVLLVGNLTVAASVFEYSPPAEFFRVRGDRAALRVVPASGWHGPERHFSDHWRWTTGRSELQLVNRGTQPLAVTLRGEAASASDARNISVSHGERSLWSAVLDARTVKGFEFGLTLPPGETTLVFATDQPAHKIGTDPRDLAFMISNLEIVVGPVVGQP